MRRREEFLKTLWAERIDTAKEGHWIDNYIREAERDGKLHEDLLGADPGGREGIPKPRASAV